MKHVHIHSTRLHVHVHVSDDFKEEEHPRGGDPKHPGRFSYAGGMNAGQGEGKASAYKGAARKEGQPTRSVPVSEAVKKKLEGWRWEPKAYAKLLHSKEFAKQLNNLPQYEGTLYRQATMPKASLLDTYKPGKVVSVTQNIATSAKRDPFLMLTDPDDNASGGDTGVLFEIRKGHGADVGSMVDDPAEEVIVPIGRSFKVVSVSKKASGFAEAHDHPVYHVLLEAQE